MKAVSVVALLCGLLGSATNAQASSPTTTIVLALSPGTPAQNQMWQNMISTFEKAYPAIHVSTYMEPASTNSFRALVETQLRSGTGPEIFGYSPGPSFIGAFAKAGLLYDLTSAYKSNHWNPYPWTLNFVNTNGKLYGVPSELDIIGIYYNKTIFAKYGLLPPKNYADFTSEMQTLKSHGVTPIIFPDQDAWEGGHLFSEALASNAGPEYLRALETGKASWNSPAVIKALTVPFVDWPKNGYMQAGADAITYANANAAFASGKAAMFPTGEWDLPTIETAANFPIGYFPYPSATGTGSWVGGVGYAWIVSAKTKHASADMTFLNWSLGSWYARWSLADQHFIPAHNTSTQGLSLDPVWQQMYSDVEASGYNPKLVGPNIDVTQQAGFNTAMWNGLQGLLNGSDTPASVAQKLAAAYKANPVS